MHLITFAQLIFYKALVSVSTRNELQSRLCSVFIPLFMECLYVKTDTVLLTIKYFGIWGMTWELIVLMSFSSPCGSFWGLCWPWSEGWFVNFGEPFRCSENLWDKAHRGRGNWWLGWFYFITGEVVPNKNLSNKKGKNRHNSYHFEEEDVYGYQGNSHWWQ